MKRFFKKISYLIVPLIVLSYPLDVLFSNSIKQSNELQGEYEVWNDIYSGSINSDIVIYGSSRAWVQFDAHIIENRLNKQVYNLGMDGHNFRLQYLRHLEYLKFNKKPQHIILNVDIFTLEKRNDLYLQDQFLPYMLWNKNILEYTSNYNGFSKSDYLVPFVRYVSRNRDYKNLTNTSGTSRFRIKGYRGFDKEWDTAVDSLLAGEEKYTINFHQQSITLFEQFIKECKANDIKLTLVYAPEYIEGQRYVANREEAMRYYRNFAQDYELVFLDYSNDSLSFQKNQFYNASHLNLKGSQLFTRKLVQDLISETQF